MLSVQRDYKEGSKGLGNSFLGQVQEFDPNYIVIKKVVQIKHDFIVLKSSSIDMMAMTFGLK